MLFKSSVITALLAFAAAHPGHEAEEHRQAIAARATTANTKRALDNCASALAARGVYARGIERRKAEIAKQRMAKRIPLANPYNKRNVLKRDTTSVLNTDHHKDINATLALTDESYVFNSSTCAVLNPEGEVGPFFVPGEYIREDLRDGEAGVDLVLEAQFIDVNTCEPIVGAYFDAWNCNSTGVYSGVQTSANGNGDDASNLNNTALRGIQPTDEEGVAKFTTKFPGHYSGRTTHLHVVLHTNATVLENGTLTGGNVPHIGQLFWDQDLITEVEATYPYSTNTVNITLNADDHVFGEQETTDTTSDPVFDYVYLGDDVTDGLFSWIVIGINTSASYTPTYSYELTSGGGVVVGGDSTGPGAK